MNRVSSFAVVCVLSTSMLGAASLNLVPSSLELTPGQAFTVDVTVSDVTDLYAYQFDVGFNPLLLNATGVTAGPFLATGGSTFFIPGVDDHSSGTLSGTAESLSSAVPGVNGGGILARLNFVAVGSGPATMSLFSVSLLDSSLAGIETTAGTATVTIGEGVPQGVPEPSTGVLLAGGLAMFATVARRLRRRQSLP